MASAASDPSPFRGCSLLVPVPPMRALLACRQCHGRRYYLQSEKALAGAFYHWLFRGGARGRGLKKATQFMGVWQDC